MKDYTACKDAVLTDVAMRYCEARLRRQAAKLALLEYRKAHGSCSEQSSDATPWRGACDRSRRLEWCEVCKGSHPLWLAYRNAATTQGKELAALMRTYKAGAVSRDDS